MDTVLPPAGVARGSYELLRGRSEGQHLFRCAFISSFLDDLPMVCIQSVVDTFQPVQAALWKQLGFQPQGKKCWWEGDFVEQ